jgi:oligogalacturonide lyase
MSPHLALTVFVLAILASPVAADFGEQFPSETRTFVDRKTGLTVTALTTHPANDVKIYQTHPQWTPDGKHIIFRSRRNQGHPNLFAVNERTGRITQVTADEDINAWSVNISRREERLYFFEGKTLTALDLDQLLEDSRSDTVGSRGSYKRRIGKVPAKMELEGGFSLDARESHAYIGVYWKQDGEPRWGIRSMDLETGELQTVINHAYEKGELGHIQANPWRSGEILYAHERPDNGGDAKQRMWLVNRDGSGHRKLYDETPAEWVTHEVWVDADTVQFINSGHADRLRSHPTGIMTVNVRSGHVTVLGQIPSHGGFWHTDGTRDGQWAVGDNFGGDLYLINRKTGERTLLTTGHPPEPNHLHPSLSPDGKRVLFNSGRFGNADLMTVTIPKQLR